jgi:ATP-dependent DNA ligase
MTPPTYPARPVNGGAFPRALTKRGAWAYEPKLNGWRALVHTPTGAMWNRKGERLSIERDFAKALDLVRHTIHEWIDCECMERRVTAGQGSLIVLDLPMIPHPYAERRAFLTTEFGEWDYRKPMSVHSLLALPQIQDPAAAWQELQDINRTTGCELFEGFVAKRTESRYPIQLRHPAEETPGWMKHRWAF